MGTALAVTAEVQMLFDAFNNRASAGNSILEAMSMSQSILDGSNAPVAIVGMGCRWAGGVRDAPGLWQLLKNKRDGWREFEEPRFSTKGFHHPNQDRPGTMRTQRGFLIDDDARLFDHAFFGITGRETETLDPSQRKLLEVVYEALENGGETWDSISGSRTGVYVGNFALDHLLIQSRDWENPKSYAATGADTSILANRISYIFNLQGPSLATNTACSSSMYALHMAVSAIRSGDCDSAIVAAANWISDPSLQIVLDKLGALSPTSRCHTFDVRADGYARGEGYAALYLKKSSIAVVDGSPIRAMIRGTAVNANGRTGGITRPSAVGQETVIRKAYENSGNLPFSDTTYFECHGTGTPAGDPIEVSAVGNVFASSRSDAPNDRLLIGSIKTNLGHTEGASAIASVMKVVLSLEAGEIPPSYGITILNPNIDFDRAKVDVVKDGTIPWPEGKLRRASINSFGFGGANGHCVIDHVNVVLPDYVKPGVTQNSSNYLNIAKGWAINSHTRSHTNVANGHSNGSLNGHTNGHNGGVNGHASASVNGHASPANGYSSCSLNGHTDGQRNGHHAEPSRNATSHSPIIRPPPKSAEPDVTTRQRILLPFSAHIVSSLKANIDILSQVIDQHSLADVAYTLASRRSKLQQRSFRIVDKDDVAHGLTVDRPIFSSPVQTINVGFIFTGQGAQWHAMGAKLFEYRVFRTTIAYLDEVISVQPTRPPWSIVDVLSGECEENCIQTPEASQTACTAVQIGMVDLLASWSVRPSAVAGHSSGEMAAAYASGHITAAEAITAAFLRGKAVSKNKQQGAMLAVGLGLEQMSEYLDGKQEEIQVAAINSPDSVTLSGEADAIEVLSATLNQEGIFNRTLRTGSNAYHSHHMRPLGRDYSVILSAGLANINQHGMSNAGQRYSRVPWISSVTPDKAIPDEITEAYWRANLESPVRFSQAVSNMVRLEDATVDALVEIGPHPALKSPLDQILKSLGISIPYIASLKRGEDSRDSMLQLAGSLFGLNAPIDMVAVNAMDDEDHNDNMGLVHGCTAIDLPPYQYTYGPINYYESRVSKEYRLRKVIRHDLLGSRVPGTTQLHPQWRNVLRVKDLSWLGDHRLLPDAVFPAAGFICMAVEAASRIYYDAFEEPLQITGYTFRNVNIKSALRIPEDDDGIEIIFNMGPVDVTTPNSPSWVSYTISSVARDSNEWTEHCSGLVKVEVSTSLILKGRLNTDLDTRFPDVRSWYKRFAAIGIGYGPTFQALSDIQADPNQNVALATVALNTTANTVPGGESSYPLHPASLDATFQLGLIACYGGQVEKASTAFVPVHLSQLYLKNRVNPDSISCTAIACGKRQGLRGAYINLQMLSNSGDVVLDVDTLRCISYSEPKLNIQLQSKAFSSPFTRLTWKPDIRTLTNPQLRQIFPSPPENNDGIAPLERADMIAGLVLVDIYDTFVRVEDRVEPRGELRHWVDWCKHCVEQDQRENMTRSRHISFDERHRLLQALYSEAGDSPEAKAAKRLHENMGLILSGQKTGLDILVPDGLLTALYETGPFIIGAYPQLFNTLDCLGHANPNMRILEVGAGTGGATRVAMKALVGANGIKRYADYTFTDISAGFLNTAQESMSEFSDVKFSVLDIEQDPVEQGYEPAYDVVLASQAIHATTSMDRTLANCKKLLKPGGKLLLVESTRMRVLPGLLYGTLTGYWLGVSDGRSEGPFMDLPAWDLRLRKAGFSGTELFLDDYPHPHNTTSVIVSTLVSPSPNSTVVHLLHGDQGVPPLLSRLSQEYALRGISTTIYPLDKALEVVSPNSRVVAFLEGKNLLLDANEGRLQLFQHLAQSTKCMTWLTSCGIVKGRDPDGAFVTGLLRAIGTENPASRFLSVDIDAQNFDIQDEDLVRNIVDHEDALQRPTADGESEDREFVWQDGCMWVSRAVPDTGLEPYANTLETPTNRGASLLPLDSQGPVRAAFETPGILSSLYFRPYTELWQPLPPNYIEVKVSAVGLNWKDLGLTSGRFDANGNNLSSEYAGIVTKTGTDVVGFSVGDRVYGMGRGHFGTHTRVPAAFAQKLLDSDSLIEAATIPVVFMTAVYAFDHVARLRKGQKVLIQSASGGLGLAAIQLAQSKGADVFATAGTEEKIQFLTDSMGIPSSHVFSSRDPSALSRAASVTGKGGFDVILSTVVGGELLYESLKFLAPMGHLIDVGRLDVLDSKTIGLELFQKNASFSSFDLNLILDHDPELGGLLMKTVNNLYLAGQISPIRPFSVADVSKLDQVLLAFSKGAHIGKMVVTFENPSSVVKIMHGPPATKFDPEARYIITGGLGGLGRSIIRWMVEHGARDFVILSRRGISTPQAQMMVDKLTTDGIRIAAIACDISQRDQVFSAIQHAASNRPVRGLIHAALSLSDLSFDKLTIDQWRAGTAAKTQGTQNLHEATISLPLDFFIMTTSTESIWAPPTQSAYVAASNFQDFFARYRRQLGLPASTMAFGLVNDVGSDWRHGASGTVEMYSRNKALTMTEHQVLARLEPAFVNFAGNGSSLHIGQDHDPLSVANCFTCLDPAAMADQQRDEAERGIPSTTVPRWYADGRVSLIIRAMKDTQRHVGGSDAAQDAGSGGFKSAISLLRTAFDEAVKAGPGERDKTVELVTTAIVTAVADMLFIDASSVNISKSVADHGVDSLIAAELRNWFHQALGTDLRMLDLLDAHTSIRALATGIVDRELQSIQSVSGAA
ncbi:type I polyketide synthase [Aspergillus alliaceus]|uniref:type I polyketide synthase n=1 Tax=Petromyces alliaceus TaxID=209559 RepID=UPI0012A4EAF7|nr:uncharacterized protein BDW43DRAFT_309552 [Aspergillus alliaceus]KAB8235179.1 hypothetical protein BDW43DRAFT_309552 [Aspergillus alliaceus]